MNNNIKFYIPFEGFYCSVYDSIIDGIIESEISEGYLTEEETEKIDYTNLHLELSQHIFDCILELFNNEFDLFTDNNYITFDGLYSPKYYNYSTDKIKAIISPEIYLTLLNKFENNNSWGYNPSFHMAVDKYYGSKDQLKAFIDAAHSKGIAVILDVVFNHVSGPTRAQGVRREQEYENSHGQSSRRSRSRGARLSGPVRRAKSPRSDHPRWSSANAASRDRGRSR